MLGRKVTTREDVREERGKPGVVDRRDSEAAREFRGRRRRGPSQVVQVSELQLPPQSPERDTRCPSPLRVSASVPHLSLSLYLSLSLSSSLTHSLSLSLSFCPPFSFIHRYIFFSLVVCSSFLLLYPSIHQICVRIFVARVTFSFVLLFCSCV